MGSTNLGGGSLFGNTASKPTGLFGNTTTSTGLFGSSGFGSSGGFGATNNNTFGGLNFGSGTLNTGLGGSQPNASASSSSSNVSDQIQLLTVLPYGDSPLYKDLRPATGKTENLLKPSVVPQKPNADNSNFKVSTQINNIVTRKAHTALEPSKKSLFDKVYDDVNQVLSQQRASPRYLKLRPKSILNKTKILSGDENGHEQTPVSTENTNKENGENGSTFTVSSPYSPSTEVKSFSK